MVELGNEASINEEYYQIIFKCLCCLLSSSGKECFTKPEIIQQSLSRSASKESQMQAKGEPVDG